MVTKSKQTVRQITKRIDNQTALAEMLGVSQQRVSQWVTQGHVPDKYILRIRDMCKVHVLDLASPDTAKIIRAALEDASGG